MRPPHVEHARFVADPLSIDGRFCAGPSSPRSSHQSESLDRTAVLSPLHGPIRVIGGPLRETPSRHRPDRQFGHATIQSLNWFRMTVGIALGNSIGAHCVCSAHSRYRLPLHLCLNGYDLPVSPRRCRHRAPSHHDPRMTRFGSYDWEASGCSLSLVAVDACPEPGCH